MTRWLPWAAAFGVLWLLAGRGWAVAVATAVMVAVWRLRGDSREERRRRPWTSVERQFVLRRAGWRCEDCGSPHELEVDHYVPFALGGEHSLRNTRCLCGPCNRRKGATHPEEYYR